MKALFIGGTGIISTAISARCVQMGWELYLLNRGNHQDRIPHGAVSLVADIAHEEEVMAQLQGLHFDVVADFIAFTPAQVERDIRLFSGIASQYIFISSASAYQKPLRSPWITESTPLNNPYWLYSRNKIACEDALMRAYRENGFPITVIRPSHTYGDTSVPLALHGNAGCFSVVERIRLGKKVIVPGDGLSLWTLTHNTDFARAFCGLMGNTHAIGETYQITGDESLTWNQIYHIIAGALNTKANLVHIAADALVACYPEWEGGLIGDKCNSVLFDNSKVKKAVPDFAATVRFDQGVRQTLAYLYAHPELQIPDPTFDAWTDQVIEQYEKAVTGLPKLKEYV